MKNWKLIAACVGIFLLGMLAGGIVVGGMVARRIHRFRTGEPVFSATEVTRFLQRRLDLDAGQRQQVHAVVVDAQAEMRAVRQHSETQTWGVISNAVARIEPVLRADQREKFERLVAERRLRRSDGPM
jgi:hypothetical protein